MRLPLPVCAASTRRAAAALASKYALLSDRRAPRDYLGRYRPEVAALLSQEVQAGTPGAVELLLLHAAPLVEFLAARWEGEPGDLLSALYLAVNKGSTDPGDATRYALRRVRLSDRRRAIREEVSAVFSSTSAPAPTSARAELRAALARLSPRDLDLVASWSAGEEIPRGADAEAKARSRALARLRGLLSE